MAQGLTIYFTVHANPLKNEDGETTYQVRQDTRGALSTKGLMKYIRDNHIMPTVELDSVIGILARLWPRRWSTTRKSTSKVSASSR